MTTTSPHDTSFAAKDVPSALMRQTLLDRELVRPITSPKPCKANTSAPSSTQTDQTSSDRM